MNAEPRPGATLPHTAVTYILTTYYTDLDEIEDATQSRCFVQNILFVSFAIFVYLDKIYRYLFLPADYFN